MADDVNKQRADAQFRKAQQAKDGKTAMAEYEAGVIATRAKTERLRALRMARDAAERAAAPPVTAKTKAVKKTKKPAGKLSDWLQGEKNSGRNT